MRDLKMKKRFILLLFLVTSLKASPTIFPTEANLTNPSSHDNPNEANQTHSASEHVVQKENKLDKVLTHNASLQMNLKFAESEHVVRTSAPPTELKITIHINKSSEPKEIIVDNGTKLYAEQFAADKSTQTEINETKPIAQLDISSRRTENLSQSVVSMTAVPAEENVKKAAPTVAPTKLKRQKKSTFDKNSKISDPSLVAPGEKILEFKPQEFIYQPSSGHEAIHASRLRSKRDIENKIQQTATMQPVSSVDLINSKPPAEAIFQVTPPIPLITNPAEEEEQPILKNNTSINFTADSQNHTHKMEKHLETTEEILKHVSSHIPAHIPANTDTRRSQTITQTQPPKIIEVTERSLESKQENLTAKVGQVDDAPAQPRSRRDQGKEKEVVQEGTSMQPPVVEVGDQKQPDTEITVKIETVPEEAVNSTPEETSLTEDNGTMSSSDDQSVAKATHSRPDTNEQPSKERETKTSTDSKQNVNEPVPDVLAQNHRRRRGVADVSTIKPNSEVTLLKQEIIDKTTSESYMKPPITTRPELKQNIEVVVGATDIRSKREDNKMPKSTTMNKNLHVSFKIDGSRSGPHPGNFKDLIDASKGQDATKQPILDEQPTSLPLAGKLENKREIMETGFTFVPTKIPSKRDVIKALKQLIDTKMVSQPDVVTENISHANSDIEESPTTLSVSSNSTRESTNMPTENPEVQKEIFKEPVQETKAPFRKDEIPSATKEPPKEERSQPEVAVATQSEIKQEVTEPYPKIEITATGLIGIHNRTKRDEHSKIYKHSAVKSTVDLIKRALGKSIGSEQTHLKQEKISNENITVIQTVKQDGTPGLPIENVSISQIDLSEVANASTPITTAVPMTARVKRNDLYKTNASIKQSAIYKKLFPESSDLKTKVNSSITSSNYPITEKVQEVIPQKEATSEKYFKNKVDSKDLFSKINHTKITNPLISTKNNSLKKVKKDYNSKFEPSMSALYGKRVKRSGNAKIPEITEAIKQKPEEKRIDDKPQAAKSKIVPYVLENINVTQSKHIETVKLEEPLVKPTLIPESKKMDKKMDEVTKIPQTSEALVNINYTIVERENTTFEVDVSDVTKSILEQRGEELMATEPSPVNRNISEIPVNPQNEKKAVTVSGDETPATRAKRQETKSGDNETQHTIIDREHSVDLIHITPKVAATMPTLINEKNESQNIADHEQNTERILIESSKIPSHIATESMKNSTTTLKNFLEDKVSPDSVVIITDIKNKSEEKIELKNITDVTLMLHIPDSENRTMKSPLSDTNLLMIDMQNMSDIERVLQSVIPQANVPSLLAINLKIVRNNQIQNDRNRRDVQENPFSEMVDVSEDKLEKSFSEQEVSPTYSRFVREDLFEEGEDKSEVIYDEAYHDPENPLQKEHLKKRIVRTPLNNTKETTTAKVTKSLEKSRKTEEPEKAQESRKNETANPDIKVEKKATVKPELKSEKISQSSTRVPKLTTTTPGTVAKTAKKSVKPVVKRQAYPRFFYKLSDDEAIEFAKKTEERNRFKRNPGDEFRLPEEFHQNIMVEVPVIE